MKSRSQGNPPPAYKKPISNVRHLKFIVVLYLIISILATLVMSNELGVGGLIFIILQALLVCSVGFVVADMGENLFLIRKVLEDMNKKDRN